MLSRDSDGWSKLKEYSKRYQKATKGDKVFQLIARFQPVATDLRTIKSYMKIANDFARYGRYAIDICIINQHMNGLKECEEWTRDYLSERAKKCSPW